ncbi:MAG: hypothetical protein WAO35_14420 [Terriglobia bacterium]
MSSAITPSRVSPTFPAMCLKLWICVALACAAVPAAAPRVKLAGKVLDAATLSGVRTYCIDTSTLKGTLYSLDSPPERFDVGDLIERESRPKGLLSKLPWKLEADCSAPGVDAVLRFEFPATAARGLEARLLVLVGEASPRLIYLADGNSLGYHLEQTITDGTVSEELHCRNAVYNALWALVSDVRAISKQPKEP